MKSVIVFHVTQKRKRVSPSETTEKAGIIFRLLRYSVSFPKRYADENSVNTNTTDRLENTYSYTSG